VENRSTVQLVALVFGIIYLLVGLLGFIGPLIGTASFVTFSQDRHALFGIAEINLVHNLVHLLIGIGGLAAASSLANSRTYCQVVGVILLVVGVLGVFAQDSIGLIPLGGADIPIHLVSGAILAYFGFAAPISQRSR
jgi:hypothetical protein